MSGPLFWVGLIIGAGAALCLLAAAVVFLWPPRIPEERTVSGIQERINHESDTADETTADAGGDGDR